MPRAHRLASALLSLMVVLPAAAEPALSGTSDRAAEPDGVQEILDCVEQNQPESTVQQKMQFSSQDRAGGGRTILSRVQWRRFDDGLSRVLLRVHGPPDLRGSGLLLIEKGARVDMFVYLPDLKATRRVTSRMLSGSLFGSDFTYEDFSSLQGMGVAGRSERLADTTLDDVAMHVISHFPNEGAGSAYERVTSYIEKETCVALKVEMFEKGDRLRKVLTTDPSSIFEQNGSRVPLKLLMQDVRDQSQTRLEISEVEIDAEIPKKTFSMATLERPRVN